MPLHKIPLCDFKYAGEVHSGAAFKYNTAVQILKYRPRVLSKEIKEIRETKRIFLIKCFTKVLFLYLKTVKSIYIRSYMK